MIQIDDKQFWLYAAVDPQNNHLLYVRLFHSTTTIATEMFLRELAEKHDVDDTLFLVDGAQHLQTALRRVGLRFRMAKHGNRNSVERIEIEDFSARKSSICERVFREFRTQAFSNNFSNAQPETAESWLLDFASWHNAN